VKFVVFPMPAGPFSGSATVSGDLEGTSTTEFDPGSITFAGVTIHNSGVTHWDITGGVVPGLGTFVTEFDNMNIAIDRPGSPGTLFENIGKHRAVDGVAKANLRYRGTFDLVPSPHGEHHYQGVICP